MVPTGDARLPKCAEMAFRGRQTHVSSQVLASWRRSEDYGVSREVVDPAFGGSFDQ